MGKKQKTKNIVYDYKVIQIEIPAKMYDEFALNNNIVGQSMNDGIRQALIEYLGVLEERTICHMKETYDLYYESMKNDKEAYLKWETRLAHMMYLNEFQTKKYLRKCLQVWDEKHNDSTAH